ncbi:ATP-binding cassette [Lithospermum erythrorhizon]|uniref:sucrose-phosphate phosphatase n=1 Tax=Lithospermum erythrorhizon TaxID=34254 RepID=A0AAV3Q876_LITER
MLSYAVEDLEAGTNRERIPAEPTLPIYLKFSDVTYKVIIKGVTSTVEKDVLHGITGSVDPGEVLALMGPSGSGKTTLLSLLGGRMREPASGGSVTYNDQPYSKYLNSRIGFVTQDDVLFPHLTVRETLTYAARLRLPKTITREEKEKRAMDVVYDLGLERCQDTMIGGSFVRGVSGGERKRVCIGNEIIINPSLLFLDEPTSGLDSTTALKIIDTLQTIAMAGKTVVTTIHQPSSRLFHKFDKLVLLSRGSLLYFGKASETMSYFSSIGCSPLIAMNPAEFLLDLANGNMNDISVPSELQDKVHMEKPGTETRHGKLSAGDVFEYLVEAYELKVAENVKKRTTAPLPIDEEIKSKVGSVKREWGASWCEQYWILVCRGLKERRHDYFSWLRITQVLATAVILGLLWWQSGEDNPKQLEDQAGLLFFIAVFWGFFPVFTAIFTFPQERAMISKERAADMYRLSAYFVARTTSDLPLDLILPVLFLVVVYFMAGLRHDVGSFFLTIITVFLCILAAQGLGLFIGATLMDIKKATTLASVTVMTFMLAGGFFVKNVPIFIKWLRYLSFNYHTYKLLLKVQYEHIILGILISENNEAEVEHVRESSSRVKYKSEECLRITMDRLTDVASLMIVSDLDHTMVDHHDPENLSLLRFNALWEANYRHNSLLVFSTGRSPTLYKELRKEKPMLTPDITIMSVGTEITYGNSMVPDDGWVEYLNNKWDKNLVIGETKKLSELTPQSETEQRPHKVSFYVQKDKAQSVTNALSARFEELGLDVKIIYSGGTDLDILPQGAGKGQALAYLLEKFKNEGKLPKNTLACGDSGNDAELFSIPDCALDMFSTFQVANAQEELLQWHAVNAKDNPKILHATERCAAGIIQTIGHFKLGPSASLRDVSELADSNLEKFDPSYEVVKLYLFFEQWRRAEIEKSEIYLANLNASCCPSGVFIHPSGVEKPLRDCVSALRSCYGDKQGEAFRIWVDQVLPYQVGSDTWIVRFKKWEQCGEERNCCLTTVLLSAKGVSAAEGLTWMDVHQTWLDGASPSSSNITTWIF